MRKKITDWELYTCEIILYREEKIKPLSDKQKQKICYHRLILQEKEKENNRHQKLGLCTVRKTIEEWIVMIKQKHLFYLSLIDLRGNSLFKIMIPMY